MLANVLIAHKHMGKDWGSNCAFISHRHSMGMKQKSFCMEALFPVDHGSPCDCSAAPWLLTEDSSWRSGWEVLSMMVTLVTLDWAVKYCQDSYEVDTCILHPSGAQHSRASLWVDEPSMAGFTDIQTVIWPVSKVRKGSCTPWALFRGCTTFGSTVT